jgi:hypothetical protein
MKTIQFILITLIMINTLNTLAQGDDYKGAAKMEVKTFWRQAEMFKKGSGSPTNLVNMEKALAAIKQKDPAYNTSALDAEIKTWSEKVGQEDAAQQDKAKKQEEKMSAAHNALSGKLKADGYLHDLYEVNLIHFNVSELPGVQAKLNEMRAKGDELLAMDFGAHDRTNQAIKRFFIYIDGKAAGTNKRLDQIETVRKTNGYSTPDGIAQAYWEMQYLLVYWDITCKLFPQEAEYKTTLEKVISVSNKNGSIEQMKGSTANSKVEETKNRRLPEPVVSDPALEKLSIETFNKYLADEVNGTAYKSMVMQKDWSIFRNDISGVIMGRKRQVAIVYKGADGKCYLRLGIILKQDYIGNTFQNTSAADARLGGGEILCENAK